MIDQFMNIFKLLKLKNVSNQFLINMLLQKVDKRIHALKEEDNDVTDEKKK